MNVKVNYQANFSGLNKREEEKKEEQNNRQNQ